MPTVGEGGGELGGSQRDQITDRKICIVEDRAGTYFSGPAPTGLRQSDEMLFKKKSMKRLGLTNTYPYIYTMMQYCMQENP